MLNLKKPSTESDKPPLFLLAAGGTGGHVFPAEALTRELLGRGARVALVTDGRGSLFSDELVVPVHRIKACPFGSNLLTKATSIIKMGFGVTQAIWLLHKLRPTAVVGFGGYPSVPLLFAAAHTGIPIILHEQNALMGRANRTLLQKARILATSFPHIDNIPPNTKAKIIHTGNPVRPSFSAMRQAPYPSIKTDEPLNLFVMGGSLGATIFSKVVPSALALLPQELRRRLIVTQQCRKDDIEEARSAFAAAGIEAELAPFFTDVPDRMGNAHLVISRSGGGSVAELTAIGRPSILVPFAGGHAGEQTENAKAVAQAGGAWIIPEDAFTPESLTIRIEALLDMPTTLSKAAAAARAWGTINAADALADCLYDAVDLPTPKSCMAWAEHPDSSGKEFSLALSTRELPL